MTDMLVSLSVLPDPIQPQGVLIRRAMAFEGGKVFDWIADVFNDQWAEESRPAFGRQPIGCYLAVADGCIIGFCCIDCTFLGFAGPIGVAESWRRAGVGRALLISALHCMRMQGYGYAVIGNVGAPGFFETTVGAIPIQGAKPGLYPERLR